MSSNTTSIPAPLPPGLALSTVRTTTSISPLPTIAGHSYKVSFYVDASRVNHGGEFVANWDGTNLLTIYWLSLAPVTSLYIFTLTGHLDEAPTFSSAATVHRRFYYLDDVMVADTVRRRGGNLRAFGEQLVRRTRQQ